jgi:sugar lactone lactonase YvrE
MVRSIWLILVTLAGVPPVSAVAAGDLTIYSDALAAGWDDYSYSATVSFANGNPVHSGAASIAVTFTAADGGLSLRTFPALPGSAYSAIRFWIFGGAGGSEVGVYTQESDEGATSTFHPVTAPGGVWTEVVVPLGAIGSPAQIARVSIQDATGTGGHPQFFVDDIVLVGRSAAPGLPDAVADRVLGQTDFASEGNATTASTLFGPAALAIGASGRLFVADYENHRVLSWPDAATFSTGAAADLVLGQPNFTSGGSGAANNRLTHPEGVTVDPQGNVFVSDTENHRVVVFNPPLSNGMNGTPFGSKNCMGNPTLDEFCYPRALASDPQGNIYLADEFHDRILIYQTPIASNDFSPDLALVGLANPRGVAVDANGNVFASDSENDRVLEFDSPLTTNTVSDRSFGFGSDGVDCFTQTNGLGVTATTLACPIDLAVDAAGNLFVSDLYNHRILAVLDPLQADAQPAAVFGQHGAFNTGQPNKGGISAESIETPLGLAVDALGGLYLADFANNRVLAFAAPVPEPGLLGSGGASLATLLLLARKWR